MCETLLLSARACLKSSSEEFSQWGQENVNIDHWGVTGAALASRYIYIDICYESWAQLKPFLTIVKV